MKNMPKIKFYLLYLVILKYICMLICIKCFLGSVSQQIGLFMNSSYYECCIFKLFYFLQTNSGGTTQKESDCFSYSNTLSDRQLQSDVKKRKIIKKKTVKNKIINPLNNLNFTCPEESYHIDENDDASLTPPTHRQRKVMDRLRFDVE